MGPGNLDVGMRGAENIHESLGREVKLYDSIQPVYDLAFGCTPDQIFSPFGIKKDPDDGSQDIIPYMHKFVQQGSKYQPGAWDSRNNGHGFKGDYVSPTAQDLEPYFYAPYANTVSTGKTDFGACIHGTAEDMNAGGNMHNSNHGGVMPSTSKEVRTFGLRGPILLSGWGYDVVGYPVPGDGAGYFPPNFMENRVNMKHGPVDLRWDEERQVWAGGLQFLEGTLTKPIKPAESPEEPDLTGRMMIRRKTVTERDKFEKPTEWEWVETGEEIGITNRDPSLSVDPDEADYPIYVMVTRINYEWRIVYISCDNFEKE
jgi:hypothetical protein